MGVLNTNSTNYVHPNEPNLTRIENAMQYNNIGEPELRVHVHGISLDGNVIVDTVSLSTSTLAALESVNVQNTVSVTVSNFPAYPTTSTVYQGTNPWTVTGSVQVSNTVSVSVSNISAIPVVIQADTPTFYQFNNFGTFSHRGWTMSDSQIPMFAVRAKPGSGITCKISEYELGNNNANQSTIGYVWYENPTLTGAYSWVDLGTSNIQYAVFTDAYGGNTPNGISGGTTRHGGIVIGKNSSAEVEIAEIPITNSTVLAIAVQRLDSSTKLDLWFAVTLEI